MGQKNSLDLELEMKESPLSSFKENLLLNTFTNNHFYDLAILKMEKVVFCYGQKKFRNI